MSYESTAEPVKIGYLMDFLLPEGFPKTYFEDLTLRSTSSSRPPSRGCSTDRSRSSTARSRVYPRVR